MKHIEIDALKTLLEFMAIPDLKNLAVVYLETLDAAIADADKVKSDGPALKKLAHKMKSASASLGAVQLSKMSEGLEHTAVSSFAGHPQYAEWMTEMSQVKSEIQSLIDSHFAALEANR